MVVVAHGKPLPEELGICADTSLVADEQPPFMWRA